MTVASKFADAIVFIDDDETPSPGWLRRLAFCQRAYKADAVCGPVVPHFMSDVPKWMRSGKFFDRPRHTTGTVLQEAGTGNALIQMDVFARVGLFDDRFALSGGEDMDFFTRLHEAGGRVVWADEAEVEEWVPPSRTTLKYVLERPYRAGSISAYRTCSSQSRLAKLGYVAHGVARSLKGICLLFPSLVRGKSEIVKALQRVSSGAGIVSGAFGRCYEQYREVHSV